MTVAALDVLLLLGVILVVATVLAMLELCDKLDIIFGFEDDNETGRLVESAWLPTGVVWT
jgi:hypothetical protein